MLMRLSARWWVAFEASIDELRSRAAFMAAKCRMLLSSSLQDIRVFLLTDDMKRFFHNYGECSQPGRVRTWGIMALRTMEARRRTGLKNPEDLRVQSQDVLPSH